MTSAKQATRNRARRNGAAFEDLVAEELGGYRRRKKDSDVAARGYLLECKFRSDKELSEIQNAELADWFQQIARYQAGHPERTVLLAYGNSLGQSRQIWIALPIEEFKRLTDKDSDRRSLEHFRETYADPIERTAAVLKALAEDMLQEST